MSGRSRLLIALTMAASICGCSPHRDAPATPTPSLPTVPSSSVSSQVSTPPVTSAPSTPALNGNPCLVPLPAAWAAAIDRGLFWPTRSNTMGTSLPVADGSAVLTALPRGNEVRFVLAGKGERVVHELGTIRRHSDMPGGLAFAAASGSRIAFVFDFTNDDGAPNEWVLLLWDGKTRRLRTVAHNGADTHGRPWLGGYVRPSVSADSVFWVQAIAPLPGLDRSSALMKYDVTTGATRRLASGAIDQALAYGNIILFTAVDVMKLRADPGYDQEILAALDGRTGEPVAVPAGLTLAQDEPGEVSTDGRTVVWESNNGLRAWRADWGRSLTLLPVGPDAPMLAGPFVVFDQIADTIAGDGAYVLDLRTNSYARLIAATQSTVTANGTVLSLTEQSGGKPAFGSSGTFPFAQYVLDSTHLPPLPSCSRSAAPTPR